MASATTIAPSDRAKLPIRFGLIAALLPVMGAAVLFSALWMRVLGVEAFECDGPSMEPTLLDGDRFAIDKSAFGLWIPFADEARFTWAGPEVGEVVVLRSPSDDIDVIKRVVGLPGDRIEVRDDVVYRNGRALFRRVLGACGPGADPECEMIEEGVGDRVWRTTHSTYSVPDTAPEFVVPPGHVFVLGDHRDRSNDSRNPRVGPIPFSRLKGRALYVYWSVGEVVQWDRVGQEIR